MEAGTFGRAGYVVAPSVVIDSHAANDLHGGGLAQRQVIPSRIMGRSPSTTTQSSSTSTCTTSPGSNACDGAPSVNPATIGIAISVAVPALALIIILIYLHRRSVKRQRAEDNNTTHKAIDFGMGERTPNKKRKSILNMLGDSHSRALSLDMNLSSPYLLSAGVQDSRESLNSLARTLHNNEDPYRPVAAYISNRRSMKDSEKGRASPTLSVTSQKRSPLNDASLLPQSPASPRYSMRTKSPLSASSSSSATMVGTPTIEEEFPKEAYEMDSRAAAAAPPVPLRSQQRRATEDETLVQPDLPIEHVIYEEPQGHAEPAVDPRQRPDHTQGRNVGLGLAQNVNASDENRMAQGTGSYPDGQTQEQHMQYPLEPSYEGQSSPHHQQEALGGTQGYGPPPPQVMVEEPIEYYHLDEPEPIEQYPNSYSQDGLAVPQRGDRRRSVGFRPLPPDEAMDIEDPEVRANRIRSFYKEYFDESKPHPPMPQPSNYYAQYDDDDDDYLGDAAYFDPETNQFIMPSYAQPVTRRAMTPPPSSSRVPYHSGPQGSTGPGPRGPGGWRQGPGARPGSAGNGSFRSGRHGGSIGSAGFGPRPDSSASARLHKLKARRPPLRALTTLPTPAKLGNDSFAHDFAPPRSYGDRAAGRSQSPLGERRPYSPRVPVSSPLVGSFDEITALPSPHLLRKSSTFTSLDFAPPKRFKDDASQISDAGSVRSARSGLSAMNARAIRDGAGRVSRLPGDVVFTAAQSAQQLKPTWKMGN